MFERIDEKKIAYLVGFLMGDGAFCSGFGKRIDRIAVTTTDEEVVDWISLNIEEFSKNNPKLNNNVTAGIYAKTPAYTKTFGVQHTDFFRKFGLMCKKEDRVVQNISKQNMRCFLLGFLDADGCITFTQRKDRDRIVARVGFTHPSLKLLEKLQNFLAEELNIPSAIAPKGKEKCYVWSFNKIDDTLKFCQWLYSDMKDVVLTRKHSKWLELEAVVKEKRDGEGSCYPKEFTMTPEYISLVSSIGKFMFCVNGNWYPSAGMAARAVGVDKSVVHSRCSQGNMGWMRRPKTEEEKKDFLSYTKRQIKKLYSEWLLFN